MTALDRRTETPGEPVSITHAARSHSEDMDMRLRRYLVSMAIRVACFVSMYWVPGWWKLVCVAGAAFIPTVAVVLGNAADRRSVVTPDPEPTFAVSGELLDHHVIPGEVVDD